MLSKNTLVSSARSLFPLKRRLSTTLLRHPTASIKYGIAADDVSHVVRMVKSHDPAGDFPGRLLPSEDMKLTYYAVRSFWVETGLRFGSTAKISQQAAPLDHIEWWQAGIRQIYNADKSLPTDWDHPTLRILQVLVHRLDLSQSHFDDILLGRRKDLDLKQYATLDSLVEHVVLSCGSLNELVLESAQVRSDVAYDAAKLVGICHGLTNALRTSIPVISTTGKLIVPHDLCVRYGVKSPRYLLSALGLGDEECRRAFHCAIKDIVELARDNLDQARALRNDILALPNGEGERTVAALLPGLASETFLNRLESAMYDLTDRNLRHVGAMEHAMCAGRIVKAYIQKRY